MAPKAAKTSPSSQNSVYGTVDPTIGDFPALRNATSRTFPDRRHAGFTTEVSSVPVNYQDSSGHWQPIDDSMVSDTTAGFAYRNKANGYLAQLPQTLASPVSVSAGKYSVSFSLSGAGTAAASASGSTVTYPDALGATDVTYTATPSGLKEALVLHDSSAPASFTYALSTAGGITAEQGPGGSIAFVDGSGHTRLRALAPVVVPQPGVDHQHHRLLLHRG